MLVQSMPNLSFNVIFSSLRSNFRNRTMKLAAFVLVYPSLIAAESMCPFLDSDAAPPIEFNLPATALAHPIIDLPLKFQGIHPIVTRRDVPYGSTPKVIVQRYSSAPEISYDAVTKSVVITSASCSATTTSTSSAFQAVAVKYATVRWMALAAATLVIGLMDESMRPVAATLAISTAFTGAQAVSHGRLLQEVCMPTVEVIVEAPAAYQGAVATCLAEIKDPIVCPDPFPTFKTCSDPAPKCGVVVVGGGAGGLYAALRYDK